MGGDRGLVCLGVSTPSYLMLLNTARDHPTPATPATQYSARGYEYAARLSLAVSHSLAAACILAKRVDVFPRRPAVTPRLLYLPGSRASSREVCRHVSHSLRRFPHTCYLHNRKVGQKGRTKR